MRHYILLLALSLTMLLLGCPAGDDDTDDDDSATGDDDTGDDDATADDDTGDDDTVEPPTGATCAEILTNAPGSPSGVYTLTLSDLSTVEVFCDMTDGGWTLAFTSNAAATGKLRLSEFLEGTGVGALDDNDSQYALADYTSAHHRTGIRIRLTWLCGEDLGAVDVTADPSRLDSGDAVWADDRSGPDLLASDGSFHNQFSDMTWNGDSCWNGQVRTDYLYGFGIGNGDGYGQYVGWFSCADCFSGDTTSTAVSDGAEDNVPGTVAGWIR
jgi:hypothetical protein